MADHAIRAATKEAETAREEAQRIRALVNRRWRVRQLFACACSNSGSSKKKEDQVLRSLRAENEALRAARLLLKEL